MIDFIRMMPIQCRLYRRFVTTFRWHFFDSRLSAIQSVGNVFACTNSAKISRAGSEPNLQKDGKNYLKEFITVYVDIQSAQLF